MLVAEGRAGIDFSLRSAAAQPGFNHAQGAPERSRLEGGDAGGPRLLLGSGPPPPCSVLLGYRPS